MADDIYLRPEAEGGCIRPELSQYMDIFRRSRTFDHISGYHQSSIQSAGIRYIRCRDRVDCI